MAQRFVRNGPTAALVDTLRSLVVNYGFLRNVGSPDSPNPKGVISSDFPHPIDGGSSGGGGPAEIDEVGGGGDGEPPIELSAGSVARWSSGVPTGAALTVQILHTEVAGTGGLHGTEYIISDGVHRMKAKAFITLHGRLGVIGKFGVTDVQGDLVQAGFDPDPTSDWLLIRSAKPSTVANPGVAIGDPEAVTQQTLQNLPIPVHRVEGNVSHGCVLQLLVLIGVVDVAKLAPVFVSAAAVS
jgi:hypothetical protein